MFLQSLLRYPHVLLPYRRVFSLRMEFNFSPANSPSLSLSLHVQYLYDSISIFLSIQIILPHSPAPPPKIPSFYLSLSLFLSLLTHLCGFSLSHYMYTLEISFICRPERKGVFLVIGIVWKVLRKAARNL